MFVPESNQFASRITVFLSEAQGNAKEHPRPATAGRQPGLDDHGARRST